MHISLVPILKLQREIDRLLLLSGFGERESVVTKWQSLFLQHLLLDVEVLNSECV